LLLLLLLLIVSSAQWENLTGPPTSLTTRRKHALSQRADL